MNHIKLRTLFVTALTLCAVQASFASGCRWPCDPPTPRNGWQPASTAKALPQTAAVQAATAGSLYETPSDRNSMQPAAKTLPASPTAKARLRAASGR